MDWREAETATEGAVPDARTVPAMVDAAATAHAARDAQRYVGGRYDRSLVAADVLAAAPAGEFAPVTYADLRRHVRRLATGFRTLGVRPDDRVGILARTRMEWALSDLALLAAGGVVTSLYPDSSERRLRTVVADADLCGVVVEDAAAADRLLAADDARDRTLEFVVVVDACDHPDDRVTTLGEVYRRGDDAYDPAVYETWVASRDAADLATLIYTSGTTGDPEGVRLTHGNLRANVVQCSRRFGRRPDRTDAETPLAPDGVALSYLPLAHVFERTVGHVLMLASGMTVAYSSPEDLRTDLPRVRPTVLTGVPRVYEKLYDAVRSQVDPSPVRSRLFAWAMDVGRRHQAADDPGASLRARYRVADRLAFSSVRDALGGRIRYLISGGSRLNPALCARYHAMGLPILEGYGLTETAPVVAVNPPERPRVGTIGPPLPGVEVRLDADAVPDDLAPTPDGGTAAQSSNPSPAVGELLVRGPNVTGGYWRADAATAGAFDGEWFRTGDVVERRADGYLVFRGRVDHLLSLSTGKTVAPGPIEDALADSPVVEQCMVVGDGRKFVGALVVPDVAGLRAWADADGLDLSEDRETLCADDRVRDRVDREVERCNERFEPHERIKRFRLVAEPFTRSNGLLTATMKKRRAAVLDRHAEPVTDLYRSG